MDPRSDPEFELHNHIDYVGTVPIYKMYNIGTELSYATLKLELD